MNLQLYTQYSEVEEIIDSSLYKITNTVINNHLSLKDNT
jgi:hypothetical protein